MTSFRKILLLIAALTAVAVSSVSAQDYPNKPVRVIVPFAAGGLNDVVGRLVATHLSERLGKKFIVENRTGAGGVVGSEIVAKAPPDGYTLGIVSLANAVQPSLIKLSYDGRKAFAPIAFFVSSPNALAVNAKLPINSLKELIAYAKQKPGELQYASGGVGGSMHLAFELFKDVGGIDALHVPFRGASPAIVDVVGGHTQALIATVATLSPHIRSGKLKALAVASRKRSPALPDVPTFAEAGLSGYEGGNWMGIAAPAGTPAPIIAKLHKEISEVQKLPDVVALMTKNGAEIEEMTSAQFATFMTNEIDKWARVIKARRIKPQ